MEFTENLNSIRANILKVIVGKDEVILNLLTCLVCGGHALLEDVPGTGKTLLAKTLAKSLDCTFKRIQFTPDLLPSDLSGINFFNQKSGEFVFREGPLFTNILLADEINRATPRTQSALLECMEEKQITIDGKTHVLEQPFMVVATQNPLETQGTFPLPEAQLDRFMMKLNMGYPTTDEGILILKNFKEQNPLDSISSVISRDMVCKIQQEYSKCKVNDDIINYILAIAEKSRAHSDIDVGISPRATQQLMKTCMARALLQGRDFVIPDDVKTLAIPVCAHRIAVKRIKRTNATAILKEILTQVPVPKE